MYIYVFHIISWHVEFGKSPQDLHFQAQVEDIVGGVQEKLRRRQLSPARHEPLQLSHLPPHRHANGMPLPPSTDHATSCVAHPSITTGGGFELTLRHR